MGVNRYEIRFSGSGGQGVIMTAIVMAEAVGIYGGKYVCQTQSYGPEARGGTSKAEVVISDQTIDYPKSIKPNLLLAMNQAACDTYFSDLNPEGLLVVDSTLVNEVPTDRVVAIPFTQIARQDIGKELVANMVALGAVGLVSHIVSLDHLEKALMARIPKGTEEMNRKALRAGIEAAQKIDLNDLPRSLFLNEGEI